MCLFYGFLLIFCVILFAETFATIDESPATVDRAGSGLITVGVDETFPPPPHPLVLHKAVAQSEGN